MKLLKPKKRKLKKLQIGIEGEIMLLNQKGQIANKADDVIKLVKRAKSHTKIEKECAHHMIELVSDPFERIDHTMGDFLDHLEQLLLAVQKKNLHVLPLGCYPGKINPSMRTDKTYAIKESIFGKNKFKIAGRCTGFHCHFSLPKGTFDIKSKILKLLMRSSKTESMLHKYNTLIAMDPALTTFTQSSPFYEGQHLGKDSRMLMYRGGKVLDAEQGLYTNFQEFGELPPYKGTTSDLLSIIKQRYDQWTTMIKDLGINIKALTHYGSTLTTTWNPVKVNPNGTLEQRGMDMNHPQHITGAAILIKHILRYIHDNEITVKPSDIALKEPFKLEGDTLYITPHSHVRQHLQKESAYHGLASDDVYNYCKRLLWLGKKVMPKDRVPLVKPFDDMIKKRKTMSDEIMEHARKKGWSKKRVVSKEIATDIALTHAQRLFKEISETKKALGKLD